MAALAEEQPFNVKQRKKELSTRQRLIGLSNRNDLFCQGVLHFTFHVVYSLAMMSETFEYIKMIERSKINSSCDIVPFAFILYSVFMGLY